MKDKIIEQKYLKIIKKLKYIFIIISINWFNFYLGK